MLKGIKAVIFDLDGVITETSNLHTKAWKKMTDEEKIPFDDDIADKLRGVSRVKSFELILEHAVNKYDVQKKYSQEKFNELMDRKNDYYVESLSGISFEDMLPGAKELIFYLKENGYRLAIGSSSKNARMVIKSLRVEAEFEAIVDGTEIHFSKPHPEIFQKVADKLGLPYEQCAVIEDAASGVESANLAGMVSIGIGPESRFKDANCIPDLRFDEVKSFDEKKAKIF